MKRSIYKITNCINGKIYVGQTKKSIEHRFKVHCRNYKNSTSIIRQAIIKYSKINFKIELIEICDTQELEKRVSQLRGKNRTK